ncbi:MAG TPA: helix-turn-helix domain-containing protein, partial [Chloroflexota bacterium]
PTPVSCRMQVSMVGRDPTPPLSPRHAARSTCPVARTLDVLGDRWTLLVIRDLLAGKTRYGDFLTSAEKIPTNVLADRLRRLEREGLVEHQAYSQHPYRVEYHLTAEGRRLGAVVDAIATWGLDHFPGTRRGPLRARPPLEPPADPSV